MLYHLSESKNLSILEPRIPECAVSMFEDKSTKRICFSDNIEGCLSSLNDTESTYYVYVPDEPLNENEIYHPTVKDVIDAKVTGEVWITKQIKVKCIGIIQSQMYDWYKRYNTGLGKRAVFFHYPYKWIEKYEV